ncbi:hypothetical protein EUX98_g1315 [Antrodiella citrinella]|uniref:Uncharacterized protein n=1 Tax=Antrodiella citrinella TaxID=2447956 RepID=A0A4S4N1N3_9APHY|nr:hypothetical protein EUX98_g1315 [Antrodiella citrinella]
MPLLTHYISRFSTLTFVVCGLATGTLPGVNCTSLRTAIGVSFVVAVTTTSLLFLHRIRAVFFGETFIITCFAVILVALFCAAIAVPITTSVGIIESTMYCDLRFTTHFVPLTVMAIATVFDILVFSSVSWRLVSRMNLTPDNGSKTNLRWKKFKSCFRGGNLPEVSQALLRGGRKYFLHTIGLDILLLCVVSHGFSTFSYYVMFALLYVEVALKNVFACRLFRDTLLELNTSEQGISMTADTQGIVFAKGLGTSVVISEVDTDMDSLDYERRCGVESESGSSVVYEEAMC